KKTNQSTTESHYYLSSALPEQYRPAQWLALIRGHWAGVEVRNHWRRDVLFREDGSRSRNPNLLANMALIRNALLPLLAEHFPDTDRKSTRLNSSHVAISYAVFCLKKKKKAGWIKHALLHAEKLHELGLECLVKVR